MAGGEEANKVIHGADAEEPIEVIAEKVNEAIPEADADEANEAIELVIEA